MPSAKSAIREYAARIHELGYMSVNLTARVDPGIEYLQNGTPFGVVFLCIRVRLPFGRIRGGCWQQAWIGDFPDALNDLYPH